MGVFKRRNTLYIHIFQIQVPTYGLMITIGVIIANLLALWILKRFKFDGNDFIILEAYTFLGAFFGAKALYLFVSYSIIDWSRIFELDYFNELMRGGFVFYGGLIGGIIACTIGGKIHRLPVKRFIQYFIWLIPFIHCFGRIGCHLVGCCYGQPYHGPFSIVYHEGTLAPTNIELFPVQLIEAICLFLIAMFLLILILRGRESFTLGIYIVLYGILRFVLEFYRGDSIRGEFLYLSTSQWISICLISYSCYIFYRSRRYHRLNQV